MYKLKILHADYDINLEDTVATVNVPDYLEVNDLELETILIALADECEVDTNVDDYEIYFTDVEYEIIGENGEWV